VNTACLTKQPFYKKLQEFISHRLSQLRKIISDNYKEINSFNDTYKYIYYNHMNLAIKTSVKPKTCRDALQYVSQIYQEFRK